MMVETPTLRPEGKAIGSVANTCGQVGRSPLPKLWTRLAYCGNTSPEGSGFLMADHTGQISGFLGMRFSSR